MDGRAHKLLLVALGVSLMAHALIAWPVWDLPIGRSASALFAQPASEAALVPVERAASEDVFGDEAQPVDPIAAEGAGERPETVERTSRQMLERIDPAKLVDAADDGPVKPTGEPADQPREAEVMEAGPPAAPPAKMLDATRPLLEHADADVMLPQFVAPTDGAQAPPPSAEPIAPVDHLSIAQLVRALKSDDPVGAGAAGEASDEDLGVGAGVEGGVPGGTGIGPGTATGMGDGTGDGPGGRGIAPLPALPPAVASLPEPEADERPAVHLDGDFEYVLRTYAGPVRRTTGLFASEVQRDPGEPAWFEVQIRPRQSLQRLKPLSKDVIWVVDTSASIEKKWLQPVKAGVSAALDTLNAGDRFNIVMFEQRVRLLNADGLVSATDENVKAGRAFIGAAEVAGYTDVNKALGKLVKRQLPPDRVYQIVFISDGTPTAGAISPQQIIDVFTRENAGVAAIYAVAVGDEVNEPLLASLAYRNKGYVERPANWVQATAVIRDLASRLRYPILKDAAFNAAGVDARQIYPRQPRDVHQHDPISLFGRFDRDTQLLMRFTGTSGERRMTFSFDLKFADAEAGEIDIAQAWAKARVHHLMSEMLRRPAGETAGRRDQIEALKKRYGLK